MYCNMDVADTNFLFFAEIAMTPWWRRFYRFRDQGLRNLVQHIPSVIAASKSQNTIKSYVHAFRRFERWTAETSAYPATPESMALYLLSLSQSGNSAAVMANAHAAIAWMHQTAGYTDPTSDPVYRTIYDGVHREQATTVVHKKPLDADMIERMRACVTQPGGRIDLDDFRIYTFVLISFAGFLRFQEASQIRRHHLQFCGTHIDLFLPQSKTDQYRQGKHVIITATGTRMCPVECLAAYCTKAGIGDQDQCYIFRNVFHDPRTRRYSLRPTDAPMTYTCVRDAFRALLHRLGEDPSEYGLHSMRSGGGSAATNAGVEARLVSRHGRWKTGSAEERYNEDSLANRMQVTLNLGL